MLATALTTAVTPGQLYGRLRVVWLFKRLKANGRHYYAMAECSCVCGGRKAVRVGNLQSGNTRSCRCSRARRRYRTPEYTTWATMLQRCTNEKCTVYANYGGRGITVCARWRSFDNFLEDMGERPSSHHSLDRINNAGNYEPGNCRWATRAEQAANKRPRKDAQWVTHPLTGEVRTVAEWARVLGVPVRTLYNRVERNWSPARVLGGK